MTESQTSRFSFAIVALLTCLASAAEVQVSFPLQGYYRIGKYMPVRIDGAPGVEAVVTGGGLLPVRVHQPGGSMLAPMLALAPPDGNVSVGGVRGKFEAKPLGDNDFLVGTVGTPRPLPGEIIPPGRTVVSVALDPAQPLPEPLVAWETLDAVVFDGSAPGIMNDEMRFLLGRGVMFMVRSGAPPDKKWPWRRAGDCWVLQCDPLGPVSAIAPGAYSAIAGWDRGVPRSQRWQIVIAGMFVAIGAVAASLAPRRWMMSALSVVAGGSVALLALWSRHIPSVVSIQTTVVVKGIVAQEDEWSFLGALRETDWKSPWPDRDVRPILRSAEQASELGLILEYQDERFRLRAHLLRRETLAVLRRYITRDSYQIPIVSGGGSPTQSLVRQEYLSPGVRVVGESPPIGLMESKWPSVFLERARCAARR